MTKIFKICLVLWLIIFAVNWTSANDKPEVVWEENSISSIYFIPVSPDGKLRVVSNVKIIKIYNVESGKQIACRILPDYMRILKLRFISADSLLIIYYNNKIRSSGLIEFDIPSQTSSNEISLNTLCKNFIYDKQSGMLYSLYFNSFYVWYRKGELVHYIEKSDTFYPLNTLLYDGGTKVVAVKGEILSFYDLRTGEKFDERFVPYAGVENRMIISPDSRMLIISSHPGVFHFYDLVQKKIVFKSDRLINHEDWVFTEDSKLLYTYHRGGAICKWNMDSMTCIDTVGYGGHKINEFSLVNDKYIMAFVESGNCVKYLDLETEEIEEMIFFPFNGWTMRMDYTGEYLLQYKINYTPYCSYDQFRIFDLTSLDLIRELDFPEIDRPRDYLAPGRNWFIYFEDSSTVKFIDIFTDDTVETHKFETNVFFNLGVSHDYKYFITPKSSSSGVDILTYETKELVYSDDSLLYVGFSPRSKYLIGGETNNGVLSRVIRDFATKEIKLSFDSSEYGYHFWPRFTPDEKNLVYIHEGKIKFYDIESGVLIRELQTIKDYEFNTGLYFSSDGKYMIERISGTICEIKLWNLETGLVERSYKDDLIENDSWSFIQMTSDYKHWLIHYSSGTIKLLKAPDWIWLVSVEEPPIIDLSIYPNPASETITIQMPNDWAGPVTIELLSVLGECVYSGRCAGTESRVGISVDGLAAGVYFLRARCGGDAIARKVVVSR